MSEARILIVEDEPALTARPERRLRAKGYEVLAAQDGQRAWTRAFDKPRPDPARYHAAARERL